MSHGPVTWARALCQPRHLTQAMAAPPGRHTPVCAAGRARCKAGKASRVGRRSRALRLVFRGRAAAETRRDSTTECAAAQAGAGARTSVASSVMRSITSNVWSSSSSTLSGPESSARGARSEREQVSAESPGHPRAPCGQCSVSGGGASGRPACQAEAATGLRQQQGKVDTLARPPTQQSMSMANTCGARGSERRTRGTPRHRTAARPRRTHAGRGGDGECACGLVRQPPRLLAERHGADVQLLDLVDAADGQHWCGAGSRSAWRTAVWRCGRWRWSAATRPPLQARADTWRLNAAWSPSSQICCGLPQHSCACSRAAA